MILQHSAYLTMALQVYSTAPTTSMLQTGVLQPGILTKPASMFCIPGDYSSPMRRKGRVLRMGLPVVRASLDAATAVGQVKEVDVETFWPTVKAAGNKAVVLDMYTQWCGPCKVMAPKFQQLSEKYQDVVFLKLDCNHHNRPLAKELGIKVVPTFKIFKDSKVVKEVTGTKFDDLVVAIENARGLDQ